jgi:putative sterol carrier protein
VSRGESHVDAITEFFHDLDDRGHVAVWGDVVGAVAIELVDGRSLDRWIITIDKGDVAVSHDSVEGDCSIRLEKALFEQLIRGEANAMAAVLRRAAIPSGNLDMLLALQRVFPGPRDQQRPAPIGRSNRWEP